MPTHWEPRAEPIPGYRLIERLGRGGFGEVWKAEAPGGLFKAIKFAFGNLNSTSDQESGESHAAQELKALARVREIRHPFILSMERFDVIEGQLIIVSELADRDLEHRLRECQSQGLPGIPRRELLKYMSEAAEALDLMNTEYDLQHLDIKPQNLFLIGTHIKVADFGLVKDLEGMKAKMTGGVTPLYAAPETFDGWVSRASDQYSLAIVYQELLTGQRPFTGKSVRQLMMQHLMGEADLTPLPENDREAVKRALSKDPTHRFANCVEFIEMLRDSSQASITTMALPDTIPMAERVRMMEERADLLDSRSHQFRDSSQLTMSMSSSVHFDDLPIDEGPTGQLCPTLVIGVGQMGLRLLEKLRSKLQTRFGDTESWPAMRLLGIDCDPQSLREVQKSERLWPDSYDQLLTCKLKKPTRYLEKWDEYKHISAWLDPNSLFQITAHGTTSGNRGLGRLAFVENYRRIVFRLRHELESLMSAQAIQRATTATGLGLRINRPRVLIAAGMGGGTGSGMFIDLCYAVRRVLREGGLDQQDIQGMLLAGIDRADRVNKDLRKINHYALAQNILDLSQPAAEFSAVYEKGGNEERFYGSPVDSLYFFDASAEHLPDPKDHVVIDAVADFVLQNNCAPLGRHIDDQINRQQLSKYRSFGWFSLVYPERELYRQSACRLCHAMVSSWQDPIDGREELAIKEAARELTKAEPYRPDQIATAIVDACNALLPEDLPQMISRQMAECDKELREAGSAKMGEVFGTAIKELKKTIGLDPGEEEADFEQVPLLDQAIRTATANVVDNLVPTLKDQLAQMLQVSGPKLERARVTWEVLQQFFLELIDRQEQLADQHRRQVGKAMHEITDRINAANGGRATHDSLIRSIENYALERIQCRIIEQVVQAYRLIRSRIADRARDLVAIRQHFELLRESLRAMMEDGETTGGFCEQTIFPGGQILLADAVEDILACLDENARATLETHVDEKTFKPRGGLWNACTSRDGFTGLGRQVVSDVTEWLRASFEPSDAALAFLQRQHETDADRARELSAFVQWSEPSVSGIEPGGPAKPRSGTIVQRTCLLGLPESQAGQQFFQTMQSAVSIPNFQETIYPFFGTASCTFVRIMSHATPGKVLPLWLLKTKGLYENACKGRFSPEIFPQFVRVP